MWSSLLNKPQQGAYFWLDCSHLQNVPVEWDNEVERKRNHNLLLPKDKYASMEKTNKLEHTNSPQECIGKWNSRILELPQVRECRFQE